MGRGRAESNIYGIEYTKIRGTFFYGVLYLHYYSPDRKFVLADGSLFKIGNILQNSPMNASMNL